MLHFLSCGYLDALAVQRRELVVTAPLTTSAVEVVLALSDPGSVVRSGNDCSFQLANRPVTISSDVVRLPWWIGAHRCWQSERASLLLGAHGCVLADCEHGRLVSADELTGLPSVSSDVLGVVIGTHAFGAFLDLGAGVSGLLKLVDFAGRSAASLPPVGTR